jgi:hypothetical protein
MTLIENSTNVYKIDIYVSKKKKVKHPHVLWNDNETISVIILRIKYM